MADVEVTFVQGKFPGTTSKFIELDAFVIVTVPPELVRTAAAGAPEVEPINNCPSTARGVRTGTPVGPVDKTARFAVASPDTTLVAL